MALIHQFSAVDPVMLANIVDKKMFI